jgi:hypothetical protein
MTPEEQAHALTRWLEEPEGTDPPAGLDQDVVESMYALRPERAPAARVTPDEILSMVVAGPLGSGSEQAAVPGSDPAEVVAFPAPEVPNAPVQTSKRRWWRVANQWGGISAIVATAATLAFVASPMFLTFDKAATPHSAASPPTMENDAPRSTRPAASPMAEEARPARSRPIVKKEASRPSSGAPTKPKVVEAEVEQGYIDMDEPEPMKGAIIAEVAAQQMNDAPVVADGLGNTADLEGAFEDEVLPRASADDLSDLRAQADPGPLGTAWRSQVEGATLSEIDRAVQRSEKLANSGRYSDAADVMAAHITAPAAMGQAQAVVAATWYLQGDDAAGAISAISRGLSLSSAPSVARAKLELLFGDALERQGQPDAAAAAYRRAIQINATR